MSTKKIVPLEDDEQAAFVEWLERQSGVKFTAIPNSTYTKSWSVKRRNYKLGLRPGLSDMFVIISPEASQDGAGYALFIEMKRIAGSTTSKEQKEWIKAINALGTLRIQAYVAKGCDEAIKIVSHYLRAVDNQIF